VCFVHPKGNAEAPRGAEGVLVELVQAPSALIEAFDALASSA
jgi:lactoylglutathione lyase